MCGEIFGAVVESAGACGRDGATVARVVVEVGVIARREVDGVVVLGEWGGADGIAGDEGSKSV